MQTYAFFGAKKLRIFQNLCCVRTDKGEEIEAIRTTGKGGQFYFDLVRSPLWMAPAVH